MLRLTKLTNLASCLVIMVTAAACGSDRTADPETVEVQVRDKLPALVDSAADGFAFAGESTALAEAGDGFAALESSFGTQDQTEPAPPEGDSGPSLEGANGDEVADALLETIFTDDNYEGNGTWLIGPETICPVDLSGAPDPECAARVEEAELRVRAEEAGDGLDFTLLVGPDRHAPVVVELRSDRLTLVVDLGESKQAIAHLSAVSGEQVELPEVLEGVVAASLVRHGPQDVSIELAVRERVEVEAQLPSGGGRVAFSTGARDPLASVRLDAAARRLTASLDVGPTTALAPWQAIFTESNATGEFRLDWQGLSATVTAEDGADTLEVTNIGFGDGTSTVSLDELTLFALDLNPEDGRRFEVSIGPSGDAHPIAAIDPKLDLTLDFDLQPLADAGDEVAEHLLGETYRVLFDGQSPAGQALDPSGDFPGGLKVHAGTLTLSSTGADDDVVVDGGRCLVPVESPDPGAHPVLGALAAADCP